MPQNALRRVMPTTPKSPAAKSSAPKSAAPTKAAPVAAKKPTNPFVDKHPGKPGRNASGQTHRAGR